VEVCYRPPDAATRSTSERRRLLKLGWLPTTGVGYVGSGGGGSRGKGDVGL
jgi:hypothetical protein